MPDKPITTAEQLVEYLFTDNAGTEADRLLLCVDSTSTTPEAHIAARFRVDVTAKVNELVESVRRSAYDEAVQAIQFAQKQTKRTGKQGKSVRNAEMRRREAIYQGGMDAARAAVVNLKES